jgi:hypothetical protein
MTEADLHRRLELQPADLCALLRLPREAGHRATRRAIRRTCTLLAPERWLHRGADSRLGAATLLARIKAAARGLTGNHEPNQPPATNPGSNQRPDAPVPISIDLALDCATYESFEGLRGLEDFEALEAPKTLEDPAPPRPR